MLVTSIWIGSFILGIVLLRRLVARSRYYQRMYLLHFNQATNPELRDTAYELYQRESMRIAYLNLTACLFVVTNIIAGVIYL